jgi:Flp pilus assembly protein TadG
MPQPTFALAFSRFRNSIVRFRDDESGAMAFFFLMMFVLMITFGGIAIDVMRFETRRVAMQQTLDRAALAAASLTQERTPQEVVDDYFAKADLQGNLEKVVFEAPTVTAVTDAGLRRVTASAKVTSANFFMSIFSPNDFLEGPSVTEAAQGVSQIEVMLVLDITGSMGSPAVAGQPKTKIQSLREAASDFVTIVKNNDTKDGVSIGVVPYAAQVNIPENLRDQFTIQHLSSWDGIANAGVPEINCMEIPTSTYTATGVSLTSPISMAAVADSNSASTTTTNYEAPLGPIATSRACTVNAETATTTWKDADVNEVLLPTKDPDPVKTKVSRLTAQGNTYIAVGMRWGTALLDEAARPIYTDLLATAEPGMAGRPADNDSIQTRKIIILMTDGEHVTNNHIFDSFKSGPSPIWKGTDGNYAIRYAPGGPALTGGTRPTTCSGFPIPATANRYFFVPHLKDNAESPRVNVTDVEGFATSAPVAGACDPNAWFANPTWPATVPDNTYLPADTNDERDVVTVPDGTDADTLPDVVMVTATQLDWSEVWRFVRVSWVARQLYMRSGVSGGTNNYNTIMNQFRGTYLSSVANMNTLLQTNCTAAKAAGIEIYGIAFAAPLNGQTQINNCSSSPKENYYFNAVDGDKLLAAFKAIATDISELRLTQ